ncbi:class F sortase [Streptomyces sp. SKN60]|uniref:class F sortase n=1 Tax=Streptomyces sp. SKN60 TaxID=2855506 RepID=UPI002247C0E7|nr:class F sortase [Streptomyces sp. SKN60]MCX2185265.1 class F sortase [Streptomyces sp. SKN60]
MPRARTAPPSRPARRRAALAGGALALAVGGGLLACGGAAGAGTNTATATATATAPDVVVRNVTVAPAGRDKAAPPMAASEPTRLVVPSAGVDAGPVLRLGLDADREMQVPSEEQAEQPGWYTGSVTPGERGAAVLVAHYDTARGPALLRDVAGVRTGDLIEVGRADGSTARFAVREIQQVDKKDFPTNKVYGKTERPELRLITCGGPVRDGHRTDNIILFADLVK